MKKIRQYRSNQGRSPKKMEETYKLLAISIFAMFICLILLLITKL